MPDDDRIARTNSLAWLFVVAAALGPVSVLVPHDPRTVVGAELGLSLVALIVAIALRRFGGRLPDAAVALLVAGGTLLATAAIHFSGGTPNAASMFYLWVALYAFYFFPRRVALAHVAFIGVCFAVVIALRPPPVPGVSHWTTTMGSIIGAGLLVGVLRARLDALIARLGEAARTDPLTGLLNRRGFQQAVELEIERSRRTGRSFALVVCDFDHFKAINDRFGHAGGDRALVEFGAMLRDRHRRIDISARLGGEEFALLLPESDIVAAIPVAQRLQAAVRERAAIGGTELTVSFGIATFPEHGHSQEELAHCADQALYAAKALGRDHVVGYVAGETERLLAHPPADITEAVRANAIVLLAESLDLRDPSTAAHSRTVARYAEAIGRRLGMSCEDVERVRLAGVLHDVGKISVPDAVLHKPGPLSDAEMDLIRRHPDMGARLLEGAGLEVIAAWVRSHHERPDGTGYPRGLSADEIPLGARILAVADAYEAMTADRPYRKGMTAGAAWAELHRHAGEQFDPQVVEAFAQALDVPSRRAA